MSSDKDFRRKPFTLVSRAATMCGVGEASIERAVREGQLRGLEVGAKRLVNTSDLMGLLARGGLTETQDAEAPA